MALKTIDCASSESCAQVDMGKFSEYEKKTVKGGWIPGEKLGRSLRLITMEGPYVVDGASQIVVRLGVQGEVYYNPKETFFKKNVVLDEPYAGPAEKPAKEGYVPAVVDVDTGRIYGAEELQRLASACASKPDSVLAMRLEEPVKIYMAGNADKPPEERESYRGEPGAWLACYGKNDFCIIDAKVFEQTYQPAQKQDMKAAAAMEGVLAACAAGAAKAAGPEADAPSARR